VKLVLALTFAVFLDGKPVGEHRFELHEDGAERRLISVARFDVKVLGISVYRYAHDAIERWRGDCVVQLSARTDDGGEVMQVGPLAPQGCVMSFAYWNPAILKQTALLNAQTGRLEDVAVAALGDGRYRITGAKHPIELRYSPDGEWLGLDSTLAGGRRLSYRRQ
jgi:hypothetical protein